MFYSSFFHTIVAPAIRLLCTVALDICSCCYSDEILPVFFFYLPARLVRGSQHPRASFNMVKYLCHSEISIWHSSFLFVDFVWHALWSWLLRFPFQICGGQSILVISVFDVDSTTICIIIHFLSSSVNIWRAFEFNGSQSSMSSMNFKFDYAYQKSEPMNGLKSWLPHGKQKPQKISKTDFIVIIYTCTGGVPPCAMNSCLCAINWNTEQIECARFFIWSHVFCHCQTRAIPRNLDGWESEKRRHALKPISAHRWLSDFRYQINFHGDEEICVRPN